MKIKYLQLLCCLQLLFMQLAAQEVEQELEAAAEYSESTFSQEEEMNEIDTYEIFERMSFLLGNPLSLNKVTAEELSQLPFITEWQIRQLINYRRLLGDFVSVYELQAVPGWNEALVRKALPYLQIHSNVLASMQHRWQKGGYTLLSAANIMVPFAKGFHKADTNAAAFVGNPLKWQLRYKYQYVNLLKWGILLEKDSGEPFFYQKSLAGFASFHLQINHWGKITQLNLGDFAVNQGQGLIQWQSFAIGSTALGFVRHTAHIKAYTGAGEFQFNRGIALTMNKSRWRGFAYLSSKKNTARQEVTATGEIVSTSFDMSGLFRTVGELERKSNNRIHSAGATIGLCHQQWQLDFNTNFQQLEASIEEKQEPYQAFALNGRRFLATSISWSYSSSVGYWMGEFARDHSGNYALLTGILAVPHPALEWGVLVRYYPKEFQTWNGAAFGATSTPTNEKGLYFVGKWKPGKYFNLEGSVDKWYHDWLKYRISAPSHGSAGLIKLSGTIDKQSEWSIQYRFREKAADLAANTLSDIRSILMLNNVTDVLIVRGSNNPNSYFIADEVEHLKRPEYYNTHSVRASISGIIMPRISFRSRIEFIVSQKNNRNSINYSEVTTNQTFWSHATDFMGRAVLMPLATNIIDASGGPSVINTMPITLTTNTNQSAIRTGSLWMMELRYASNHSIWVIDGRLQYYQTDDYSVRIHAMERDLPTYNTMPSFYGRGWRLYAMVRYKHPKNYTIWLKVASNIKPELSAMGSGYNMIVGSRNGEIRLQTQILF